MNQILQTNIFFFITGTAVILVTAGLCVLLYFAVKILRDMAVIVSKIRKASDELEQDFEELRTQLKAEGAKVRTVADVALGFVIRHFKKRAAPRKAKTTEPELQ